MSIPITLFDTIKKHPEIFSALLNKTDAVIAVITDTNYIISTCNDNFTRRLYVPEKPIGQPLGDILCPMDNRTPLSLIFSKLSGALLPQILKICYTETIYRCYAFDLKDVFLVIGDHMGSSDNDVLESMSLLNNEMTVLSRELSRKNRKLEEANRKISELVRTDVLTGLANRRYFQERYEEAFSMALRKNIALSMIMMDLDFFKHINDTYGHDAGDKVLQSFGSMLKETIREEDLAARFGGEEFLVFMLHTTVDEAMAFAERIRIKVSETDILENGHKITISAGVSQLHPDDSPEGLIKRADVALYMAKSKGRNRCMA